MNFLNKYLFNLLFLSATQRKVTKEKSPRGKCFDKTTQSPLGVYKIRWMSFEITKSLVGRLKDSVNVYYLF